MADDDTRKHSTPRMTTRAACDALRRSPWTLRCGGLLLLGLLAWMVASWATPDAAAKKAAIRAALGSGTWNMLHRLTGEGGVLEPWPTASSPQPALVFAVKYPKRPTPQQRHDVHEFFRLFSWHYPCEECAGHFREMLAEFPIEPHSTDNQALSKWCVMAHVLQPRRLGRTARHFPRQAVRLA